MGRKSKEQIEKERVEREKKQAKEDLQHRIQEFADRATELGIADDLIFDTTFKRYVVQVNLLEKLQEQIDEGELMVKKAYVKDRDNLYVNPAVTEYNKTAGAANNTALALVKIMAQLRESVTEDDGFDEIFGNKGR